MRNVYYAGRAADSVEGHPLLQGARSKLITEFSMSAKYNIHILGSHAYHHCYGQSRARQASSGTTGLYLDYPDKAFCGFP
jgi:hypothetical protein